MLIIGERINTSRKRIEELVKAKDAKSIQEEAKAQVEKGAKMLEINCGTRLSTECEDMVWLVETVQSVVSVPLSIDSPNPDALEAGLKVHKGKALVNSITAEKDRALRILPMVKKHNSLLVALLMDEKGAPKTVKEREEIAKKLLVMAADHGVEEKDIYLDPLVKPLSTESDQAGMALETIRIIKSWGRVNTVVGLSNVSFGLPNRSLINRTFFSMALNAGLDAAIIDTLDRGMMATLKASNAVLGKDGFCMDYITAHRNGGLDQ